ncbi:MAG TPA: uracil-DNA glycosylase family protein [Actinomycetota bacterium]|nr:uracil-DNA glycosylase family protein [Actinomycetota bacterium]
MDKSARLLELAARRKATRWPGYGSIGDYHDGIYECDFVSPYTKSAGNVDSPLMILLQDWASEDVLQGPVLPERIEFGHDPHRRTNQQLKALLRRHFDMDLSNVFATNVFPFVKLGGMSAAIPTRDLVRAAREFAIPQIEIVRPVLAVCLGKSAFNAVAIAAGNPPSPSVDEAIARPFRFGTAEIWCQAHTGPIGTNNRNAGGVNRVDDDWARMAEAFHAAEQARNLNS